LVNLPSSREGRTFTLQEVFGHTGRDVQIGDNSARNLLMLHALAGLYLEGFISPNSLFAVYPSHSPGRINDNLRGFLDPVSKLFGGYFKDDLLVRAVPAIDTSLERWKARTERREPDVSFADQTNTVHVNPDYAKTIRTKDRTILVFDDFTTSGRSLDWARSLLLAAGAGRVVLMTVGKYPGPYHECYTPRSTETIAPFSRKDYDPDADFRTLSVRMREDTSTRRVIETSFERIRGNLDYPVAGA
jgi:hypoxanthine phosphoribosyltransferase